MHREKDPSVLALIGSVQIRPIIWDKAHPDYNDWLKKTDAWTELALSCGFPDANAALKRFKTLKNARRNFKRSQNNGTTSATRNYLYEKEMNFLDDGGDRAECSSSNGKSPSADTSNFEHELNGLLGHKMECHANEFEHIEEPQIARTAKCRKRMFQNDPVDPQETLNNFLSAIDSYGGNEAKADKTEGFLFGQIVGQRLDRLDLKKRAQAQMDIQQVLFRYEFE